MSNDVVAVRDEESSLGRVVITEAQVQLIKNTVALGATDDELKLFFFECRRRGVHPLDRLIHFVKRGQGDSAKVAFQCGIDFMRSQAEATEQYRGQDEVEYGQMIPIAGHTDKFTPEWAKATVKRRDPETGDIINTTATAYWEEFYPGENMGFMWRKMPRLMLGKVAESQALRKAFPRQLQGLYSFEEMEQADIIEAPARPPIKPPQSKSAGTSPPPSTSLPPSISSAKEALMAELSNYVKGDMKEFKRLLKEFTAFGDNKGLEDPAKLTEKWAGSALGKLRKRVEEEGKVIAPDPEGCTKDPTACGLSSFNEKDKAFCGDDLQTPCRYQG